MGVAHWPSLTRPRRTSGSRLISTGGRYGQVDSRHHHFLYSRHHGNLERRCRLIFVDTPSVLITIGGGLVLALINFPIADLFGAIGTGFGSSGLGQEEGTKAARALQALGSSFVGAGVIGTVVGLVNMGHAVDDPSAVWPGIATALITTFYGLMLNYAVIAPLRRSVVSRIQTS